MSSWHVDPLLMRTYAARNVEPLQRASVEAHVRACRVCRDELARLADGSLGTVSFEGVWDRVQMRVEDAPSAAATRWLRSVGMADRDTVVVAQIGRQCLQWTIASTLILALAAFAATLGIRDSAQFGFVLLAPLLPPVSVAATYLLTPTSTAALETTSPYSPARLLMWRTAYALATAVPVSVALGAVIPGPLWLAVAWLLPSAACTAVVLVGTSWTDPVRPAAVVSGIWFGIVTTWFVRGVPEAVSAPATQLVSVAIALVAGVVFTRRLVLLRVPDPKGFVR